MPIADHALPVDAVVNNREDARNALRRHFFDSEEPLPVSARLLASLACVCGGELAANRHHDETLFTCTSCGAQNQKRDSQYLFGGLTASEVKRDWLNNLKEVAKRRLGRFYRCGIELLSPTYGPRHVERFLQTFDLRKELVADFGSGPLVYSDQVLCVDGNNYANVHLVADLERLPVKANTFSGILSIAVLEHVADPAAHVAEIGRVLKPGGRVLCSIPFMQGFHASPGDFQRYTKTGIAELFKDFEILDVRVGSGPTSGMLWTLQEWLAMLLSFGSMRLYRLLLPLTWLLSPLKYLDALLMRHPAAETIASSFVIEARKREEPRASQVSNPSDSNHSIVMNGNIGERRFAQERRRQQARRAA
jgi:SAM-dependent methyltransferase